MYLEFGKARKLLDIINTRRWSGYFEVKLVNIEASSANIWFTFSPHESNVCEQVLKRFLWQTIRVFKALLDRKVSHDKLSGNKNAPDLSLARYFVCYLNSNVYSKLPAAVAFCRGIPTWCYLRLRQPKKINPMLASRTTFHLTVRYVSSTTLKNFALVKVAEKFKIFCPSLVKKNCMATEIRGKSFIC